MLRNTRRPYISNQAPDRINIPDTGTANMDESSLKTMIVDSLKMLSRSIDELKQSLNALEEKVEYIDVRQRKLENDVEKYNTRHRANEADIVGLRSDLETYRKAGPHPVYESEINLDKPLMPGAGFASVTPGYLRSLHQK